MKDIEKIIENNYLSKISLDLEIANRGTVDQTWGAVKFTPFWDKIYYVVDGDLHVEMEGISYLATPGSLLYMPGGIEQTFYLEHGIEHMDHYYCHFTSFVSGQESMRLSNILSFPYCIRPHNSQEVKELFQMLMEAHEADYVHSILRQKSLLYELINMFLDGEDYTFKKDLLASLNGFPKVIEYIHNNIQKKITNDELANLMHLHPNYFNTVFKKHVGETPIQFINRVRIEKGKALLSKEKCNISDLPEQLGYRDIYYFSKAFKKSTGMSPRLYRKLHGRTHS